MTFQCPTVLSTQTTTPRSLTPMLELPYGLLQNVLSNDIKIVAPSPADSQPEAASKTVFLRPTEPKTVPKANLLIENEKEDWVGAFSHIKIMSSNMPFIRLGMRKKPSSCMRKDSLLKVLTKRRRSLIVRQGSLMTEDEASTAKIEVLSRQKNAAFLRQSIPRDPK